MDVICDTSFLMVIASSQIKCIDIMETLLGKFYFLVPSTVISELKHLEKIAGDKRAKIARAAIELAISKFKVVEVVKSLYADDAIVEYAVKHECAAATIDKNLRNRLIANKILVLTLSRNKLIIANP
jgi:rRNA-processing protein FCF1